ncbi:MAG: hypothetical protein H6807_17785 [Planctomycetes bacterium]|nr:hypothetical protein [Planctomycetota bacterium]
MRASERYRARSSRRRDAKGNSDLRPVWLPVWLRVVLYLFAVVGLLVTGLFVLIWASCGGGLG